MRWLILAAVLAGCAAQAPVEVVETTPAAPTLSFLEPVTLQCPDYPQYRRACDSFGEPQLDVAGDGTIWYSSVCCIGQSPPIWRSFDGGLSFEGMPNLDGTGAGRDAFGIEGDFGIDDAGNVFFFDISAATAYLTKFQSDGTHVHTKADPFPPLVDRPWVRAGAEDQVFIVYNGAATGSWFYRSDDGGLTWDIPGGTNFDCGLAGFGQGPVRDHLLVTACDRHLWQSFDGGKSWGEPVVLDVDGVAQGPVPPAFADDDGTAYVPMIFKGQDDARVLAVAAVPAGDTDGKITELTVGGRADYPWLAAGKSGQVAIAYYGADDDDWYIRVAYSQNADAADPDWTIMNADPEPVFKGDLRRDLGDFLQIRHAENGDLVVAYAARTDDGFQSRFVRSTGMDMGHGVFRNGPQ